MYLTSSRVVNGMLAIVIHPSWNFQFALQYPGTQLPASEPVSAHNSPAPRLGNPANPLLTPLWSHLPLSLSLEFYDFFQRVPACFGERSRVQC